MVLNTHIHTHVYTHIHTHSSRSNALRTACTRVHGPLYTKCAHCMRIWNQNAFSSTHPHSPTLPMYTHTPSQCTHMHPQCTQHTPIHTTQHTPLNTHLHTPNTHTLPIYTPSQYTYPPNAYLHTYLHQGPAQVVIQRQIFQPMSLAVDWIGRKLYWVDMMNQRLEVANLDGSSARVLLSASQDVGMPRGLALDLKYT